MSDITETNPADAEELVADAESPTAEPKSEGQEPSAEAGSSEPTIEVDEPEGADEVEGDSAENAEAVESASDENAEAVESASDENAESADASDAAEQAEPPSGDGSVEGEAAEAEAEIAEAEAEIAEAEATPAEAEATPAEADAADEVESDEAEAEAEAPRRRRDSPYDRPGRWFVIHTQSGYENNVRSNLLARTQSMNMEERIFEVVIPMEDVVEFKNGKKVIVQKKVFPGYLLTRMHLDDDSWFVVRNTPGVTGFIGAGNKPSPLPRRDVETFLAVKEDGDEPSRKGRPRLEYSMGETVRVKEGPFADFQGEIVEINEDQLRLKVLVNIFGRETPVELQFAEVAKI